MRQSVAMALILGASIILAAFAFAGRFTAGPAGEGRVYIVDRFSGHVRVCVPGGCLEPRTRGFADPSPP
jgi:hypothetical protein